MNTKFSRPTISLKRRLFAALAFSMLIAMGVTVFSILHMVDSETEEVLDARQIKVAESLLRQTALLIDGDRHNEAWLALETTRGLENAWLTEFESPPTLFFLDKSGVKKEEDEIKAYIWVMDDEGQVLGTPMPEYTVNPGKVRRIHAVNQGAHEWRVASVSNEPGDLHLYWAQRDDLRNYIANETAIGVVPVQLVLIPAVILALWLSVQRGMKPLSRLRKQISRRHPNNLQPVALKEVPAEILPVIRAINDLLQRLGFTLGSERSFTANAAHELRGPLAVVRNLSRNMGNASDLQEVRRTSDQLEQTVSRMADLLTQLLLLARLDSTTRERDFTELALRELVEDVVAEAIPLADKRSVEIVYEGEIEATVYGDEQLLKMMLSNLLSNALKYGGVRGEVLINVQNSNDRLLIRIFDNGPGVEPEELAHIFERFYRSEKAQRLASGSGLGLAIVERIAELHDSEVYAQNREQGGLEMTISFPGARWKEA